METLNNTIQHLLVLVAFAGALGYFFRKLFRNSKRSSAKKGVQSGCGDQGGCSSCS